MDTLIGKTLSHYRIVERIGSGGMGVVYLARDLDLERDVAVKFLPPELTHNPERLAAFRVEAKALASLNHPNIVSIYRIVKPKREGPFLVLELMEGVTLSSRLKGGALPLPEALGVCAQLADALDAAHRRGVVHRDLKPGNVMATPSGRVKILDFGLARREGARRAATSEPAGDGANTTTASATTLLAERAVAGAGTLGYASPEQVSGEDQDNRTDVFAFGCVLYECLTGRRAFPGKSPNNILVATMMRDPDWAALPAGTPAPIRELLGLCLKKDPKERLGDIGQARLRLAEARELLEGAPPASVAPAGRTPHNLTAQLSSFIGRDAEIAECRHLLGQSRLVTLLGPGGCGKTRLALRVATEGLDDYPDGVWFVDLAPLSDETRVAEAVAVALGIRAEPGMKLLEAIARHVASRRALILLDNCEHLLSVCGVVALRLLQAGDGVRVIATSRELLGVQGESAYPVRPLRTPHPALDQDLAAVATSEAVRLFVERARQVARGFALDAQTGAATAEICRRLDGMPLAIELAAARVRVLTVDQIRTKLEDRFRLLTGGTGGPERHQTLEATIQWSYDLLAGGERRLLRILSTFAGGWTLEAATKLAGADADEFEVLDSITRLVDKSLAGVEHAGGEARYSMLETVRQFAQRRLVESGEKEEARRRHLEFYLALSEEAAVGIRGAGQSAWLFRMDRELENMLLALAWCERVAGGADKAFRMVDALCRYWPGRGLNGLARRAVLDALLLAGEGARTREAGVLTVRIGDFDFRMGRYREAARQAQEGLAIAREVGDKGTVADAQRLLANAAYAEGRLESARDHFGEAVRLSRESGDRRALMAGLNSLADLHRGQGDLDAALPLYEEALAIGREDKNAENTGVVLANISMLLITQGSPDRALSNVYEVLEITEETGSKGSGHLLLDSVAGLSARLGDAAQAARLYGAGQALHERMALQREPAEERFLDPLIASARERLGARVFAEAAAAGRALTFEEAVAETRTWLERRQSTAPLRPGG